MENLYQRIHITIQWKTGAASYATRYMWSLNSWQALEYFRERYKQCTKHDHIFLLYLFSFYLSMHDHILTRSHTSYGDIIILNYPWVMWFPLVGTESAIKGITLRHKTCPNNRKQQIYDNNALFKQMYCIL